MPMQNYPLPTDLNLLAKAVGSAVSSVVITDHRLPDNPIIFCNTAFEKLTGYDCEEVIGHNCRFLQGNDKDQKALEEVRAATAEGKNCTVALRNYRKDGRPFWNELVLSPVTDDDGTITHFIGIQRDITDRMSGKDASLDRVTQISHEIKTPLTTIKSTLQILQQRGLDVDEAFLNKSLEASLRAVERLENLGKQITD
jgi:PAS domain S-box-containing protein